MDGFLLKQNIFACKANGYAVFLDVEKDSYFAISINDVFLKLINNRVISDNEYVVENNDEAGKAIGLLLSNGIVCRGKIDDDQKKVEKILAPRRDISDGDIDGYPKIKLKCLVVFLRAYVYSIFCAKILGLKYLKGHIGRKKKKIMNNAKQYDVNLNNLVISFRSIRAFFYTSQDNCYFDSAVLMYFLLEFGYNPSWVFAVKMNPFFAHCWVQVEDVMANGYLNTTYKLCPIMAI